MAATLGQVALDVLDNLREGCQVIDFDYRYVYVNDAVCIHAQRSRAELVGRRMRECFPGIDRTPMFAVLERAMDRRVHERLENEFTYPNGSTGWFDLRFIPVPEGVCILSMDTTERRRRDDAMRRLQDQLHHAQKMEAVGRLAGGVAHDFNNMLAIILTYGDLTLSDLPDDHPVRENIIESQKAGHRAAGLTRQLLDFSRQRAVEPRIMDVNEAITGIHKMLGSLVGPDIEVVTQLEPSLPRVSLDPGQFEQVVMNLAANARDAMADGGTLTIETCRVSLDKRYADAHLGTTPGPHVLLAVSDTGIGMDRDTQQRIFEPFFTTKPVSKGTGLGLSTVFGIVQQAGGSIWVYSEPGFGSAFKIYLPCVDVPAEHEIPFDVGSNGTKTILLVDDDPVMRLLVTELLRPYYTVLVAESPEQALTMCASANAQIDLLLSDIMMPEMTGQVLAERVRVMHPDIRVLYMSGYTSKVATSMGYLPAGALFLEKPITPATLARALRGAFAQGTAAPPTQLA